MMNRVTPQQARAQAQAQAQARAQAQAQAQAQARARAQAQAQKAVIAIPKLGDRSQTVAFTTTNQKK